MANGSTVKRSITAGLIGAALGYFAAADNRRMVKEKGAVLGQTVKNQSKKAVDMIKSTATQLMNKNDTGSGMNGEDVSERLDNIEEMLTELTDKVTDKDKSDSSKSSSTKKTSGTSVSSKDDTSSN